MMPQKDLEMSLVKPELTDFRLYVSCNQLLCKQPAFHYKIYTNRIESQQMCIEKNRSKPELE